jgi:hypothetical protein
MTEQYIGVLKMGHISTGMGLFFASKFALRLA